MAEINNLVLRFSGDKASLKEQLKEWCRVSGKTMNGTVIELIEELLKAQNFETK